MDPQSRTLAQVNIHDAVEADRVFSMLMGDQVEPRRDFIEIQRARSSPISMSERGGVPAPPRRVSR